MAQVPEPWPAKQFHFDPATFTKKSWARPDLAVVQIFPVAYWGSLQWQVKGIDWNEHRVDLGWGGFQINELEWGKCSTGLGAGSSTRMIGARLLTKLGTISRMYSRSWILRANGIWTQRRKSSITSGGGS